MSDLTQLPAVPILHLLWSVPPSFGGMTNVALRRVSALAEWGNREMEVLTLARDIDPDERTRQLIRGGIISNRVRIRNMWTELSVASDDELHQIGGEPEATVVLGDDRLPMTTATIVKERRDNEGRLLQTNHHRGDGTLLATDRLDVDEEGVPGGRRISLYDRSGQVASQLRAATTLYHRWIDLVTGGQRSIIISDSPVTGGIIHSYKRDHVVVIQALHNHHLNRRDPSTLIPATGKFFKLITHADDFDRLVFLTDKQREDFESQSLGSDNLTSIPNSVTGRFAEEVEPRTRERGIYVARLSPVKRIEHAIKAIASTTSPATPSLDIYGEGPRMPDLQSLCAELEVSDRVRLHGFKPDARSEFINSSFSILTSKSEGMPLVILESMAAGCIPLAYDVDYGPGDIISNGTDGFLVRSGDVDGMSETLSRLLAMDEDDVQAIRENAVERAREFTTENICAQWARVLTSALEAKASIHKMHIRPTLNSLTELHNSFHLSVAVSGRDVDDIEWAMFTWIGRNKEVYGRVPAEVVTEDGRRILSGYVPKERLAPTGKCTLDVYIDARIRGNATRRRIAADGSAIDIAESGITPFSTVNGNLSIRVPKYLADHH